MTNAWPPNEVLFEFLHGGTRIRCELVDHGDYGIEARFVHQDLSMMSQTFPPCRAFRRTPRDVAIAWAHEERKAMETAGDATA